MSSQAVDDAMDGFIAAVDYPLMVVTVGTPDGERSGCVAGFVTQCSIAPPRFLVCVSRVNHTYSVVQRAEGLALHLLGSDQVGLARLFAEQTGDRTDKFAQCDWRPGLHHAPVLSECAVWLEGSILGHTSGGDHEAYLFSPEAGGRGSHAGLLTVKRAPELHPGHPAGG
jgi:flavin reductase (DIM6/NTAB) family NADH-FMN oxidoreductase RutF